MHVPHQPSRHSRHNTRRFKRKVDQVQEDGHQSSLSGPHQRVSKHAEQRLVEKQRRRVILGQRHGEKPGLRHQRRDDARVQLSVYRVDPAVLLSPPPVSVSITNTAAISTCHSTHLRPVQREPVVRIRPGDARLFPSGALYEEQSGLDVRYHAPLLKSLKRPGLQLADARRRWRRRRRRHVVSRDAALARTPAMVRHGRRRRLEGGLILGELKTAREEGLDDALASLDGYEDEVGVVGGDEEDGYSRKREGGRQVHHARARIHASANDGEDGVRVFGDLDGPLEVPRQPLDGGLEDGLGPGAVADDGALDRRHADVEKAMLVAVAVDG